MSLRAIVHVSERKGTSYVEVDVEVSTPYAGSTMTVQKTLTRTTEVSLRGSVTADFEPPRFRFNPFSTAWEIVPYSFVIDWLYNVGQSLSSASLLVLSDKWYASHGYKVTTTFSTVTQKIDDGSSPSVSGSFTGASADETLIDAYRHPCSVPIFPPMELRLDWMKMLDIFSMLKQLAH